MPRKGKNIYHRKDGRWEGRCIIGRKEGGGYRFAYAYGRTYREVRQKLAVREGEAMFAAAWAQGQEPPMDFEAERRPAGTAMGDRRPVSAVMGDQWKTDAVIGDQRSADAAMGDRRPTTATIWDRRPTTATIWDRRPTTTAAVGDQRLADAAMGDQRPRSSAAGRSAAHPSRIRIREYAAEWLSAVKGRVKGSTYMKYRNLLYSYILPGLGELEWSGLDRETLERFLDQMRSSGGKRDQGLSAKTVADILSVVRQICRHACGNGAEMRFDISSVTVKRETKEMRILTRREQDSLYRILRGDPDDRSMGVLIGLYAGLRLGEICALKWEDISFAEQTIAVRRTMQRIQTVDDAQRKTKIVVTEPKSRSSVRQIPVPKELMRLLAMHRKGRRGYVLTGREDVWVEPRTMERYFAKILKRAGIAAVNFHTLRHTFATRCVEIGFDVKSLSVLLGHANVSITMDRYVHPSMELKRRNMQKLAELLAVS